MNVSRETPQALTPPDVSRETHERLLAYVELLVRWNRRVNLIGRSTVSDVWQRHVLDSLQLAPLIPETVKHAIDLGSGAGLPGLVLALATNIHFDLLECDERKAAFLSEAARLTDAPVTVIAARIETAQLARVPLVTSRALASLPTLLNLSEPHLTNGGCCLFLKGSKVGKEIQNALSAWTMIVERFTSCTDPAGVVLRVSEMVRAQ